MPQTETVTLAPRFSLTSTAVAALTLVAAMASAQSVVNPRIIEFDPSADHAAVLDGEAVVTEYALELYLQGAQAPFYSVSLGKPAPQGDGKIRYDFSSNVTAWPLPGGVYESRVAAVGPTGTGRSGPSNTFSFPTTCSYTLGSTTASVAATAGSSGFAITTTAGCAWAVTASASWVTPTTISGTGPGTVSFSYSANVSTSPRVATITAGGKSLTLTQAAAGCSYTLSPGSFALPSTPSGTQTIAITTTTGCAWQATTSAQWITIAAGSGAGNGSATFTVAANSLATARTGTISLGGKTVSIAQAAASCSVSVTPKTLSVGSKAGSVSVALTMAPGCGWTATSNVAWLTVGTPLGAGPATITLTHLAYTGSAARSATVTIGGVNIPFTQQIAVIPTQPKNLRVVTAR